MPKVEVRPGTYRGAHGRALTPGINDFHMVEARERGGESVPQASLDCWTRVAQGVGYSAQAFPVIEYVETEN